MMILIDSSVENNNLHNPAACEIGASAWWWLGWLSRAAIGFSSRVPWAAMGEPLEVRPLLKATRYEDLAPETKALKELKPSFTRQVGGKGMMVLRHYC